MRHAIEDVEYAEYLFDRFYGIGSCESGGVTRLGYTEVEDEMHRALCALGEEKGYGPPHGTKAAGRASPRAPSRT